MNKLRFALNPIAVMLFFLTLTLTANAQATRTWVSGVGDDLNPCSRTAPCKTFAGAISKTATGGEINVLDPGGYGTVTITKSITIDGLGIQGGSLTTGTAGVIINSSVANTRVHLRGLNFNGVGIGVNGIRVLNAGTGGTVFIEDTVIHGFTTNGIEIAPTASSVQVAISNVQIYNCGFGGVFAHTRSPTRIAHVAIEKSTFTDNVIGVLAGNNSRVTCANCFASGNENVGFQSQTTTNRATAVLSLESCVTTNHNLFSFSAGVASGGGGGGTSIVRMTNVSILNNLNGYSIFTGGTIRTLGNNKVDGNTTNTGALTFVAQQ